ncbi:MAG: hypothetical protein ABIO86_04685, partial [Sphingomonas sp.]
MLPITEMLLELTGRLLEITGRIAFPVIAGVVEHRPLGRTYAVHVNSQHNEPVQALEGMHGRKDHVAMLGVRGIDQRDAGEMAD